MLPLAITFGEPAGIAPDITLMAWRARRERNIPPFYLIADPDYIAQRARKLGFDVPLLELKTTDEAPASFDRALPVVSLEMKVTAAPGKPDASSAPAAIASIRHAVADVLAGRCARW